MKKTLLILISILLVAFGIYYYFYADKDKNVLTIETTTINNNTLETKDNNNKNIDDNPIIVGLYKYYGKNQDRVLISDYKENWNYHNDISSFEVYYTNDKTISNNNQKDIFDGYKNKYQDIDNYKIGYIINFSTKDSTINKKIISPKDTEEFYDYLEVYLYDDYHRNGEWYSHTTENDFTNETLLTSIKLTAGKNISEITSDIHLTVFIYNDENYSPKSNYAIIIKNNN